MDLSFQHLLRKEETVLCAKKAAVLLDGDSSTVRIVLVIGHGDEGALLVLGADGKSAPEASLALHSETSTSTSQTSEGFECEVCAGPSKSAQSIRIVTTDIAVLQELLHEVKRLVALADDLQLHASCRSHEWLEFYRRHRTMPHSSPGTRENLSLRSASTSDLDLSSDDNLGITRTNPLMAPNIDPIRERDRYTLEALRRRREEFIEDQDILVKCATWNMAGKELVESLDNLLRHRPASLETVRLYSVAFQEMDLSAEAYLTNTDHKVRHYRARIEASIGDHYELVDSQQLVGILICVYAHKSIVPAISSVKKSYVTCGILGMVGNKGATGIRFDVMNTSFAFLSCHFAAGQEMKDKRNGDWREVEKRIFTEQGIGESGLSVIDNIFMSGDLNYRVQLPRNAADIFLANHDLEGLLRHDQLTMARKKDPQLNSWQEGKVTFAPTYRFDIGSSVYDTSEKQRIPSWTDRILCKSIHDMELIENSYQSNEYYYQSDHKPVTALFRAKVETLLTDREKIVRGEILKELDRFENEMTPTIRLKDPEADQLHFGPVRYLQPINRSFSIRNTGKVSAQFSFSRQTESTVNCKRWLWPCPITGTLSQDEDLQIDVTICVDEIDSRRLNNGQDQMHDVLVLHVLGGVDTYLSIKGDWKSTCVGQSIEALAACDTVRNLDENTKEESAVTQSIPRTLYRVCDQLTRTSSSGKNLFIGRAKKDILNSVQESLDTGADFDAAFTAGDINNALCELLHLLLSSLTAPVVPEALYEQIHDRNSPLDILDALPSLHANVLIYLQGFMIELLHLNSHDTRLEDRLCAIMGDALIRPLKHERRRSEILDHSREGRKRFIRRLLTAT